MKRFIPPVVLLFALALIGLFSFAPDVLSLIFLALMAVSVILGFFLGLLPAISFASGFRLARNRLQKIAEVQPGAAWISVQQLDSLFSQKALDNIFEQYLHKARTQERSNALVSDIEESINEEAVSLHVWRGLIRQIPGTLTALGLLGTFLGLIIGISTIGFSSVEAVLGSIELLIGGIRTAFYTSIAGVILSILFNICDRTIWNVTLREMGMFLESFHAVVFPTVEEQTRLRQSRSLDRIVELLDRLPRANDYSAIITSPATPLDLSNDRRMMPDITRGLASGEFVFFIQPRYELNTRTLTGGEVLVRWEHPELGIIYPIAFMGVVERNGYVVRIDKYIWESVFQTLRRWMDTGLRPVPLSVNISKTDILVMDVAEFLDSLVAKYDVPPRYLELEIAETAYLECEENVRELEQQLCQRGFRVVIDGIDEEFLAMSIMKQTRADAIKLDMRYMGSLSDKRESAIDTMFEQAKKLNIPILAKCIESAEQLGDLRRSGCREGQGNYLKKPVSIEEFERIVRPDA